MKLLSRREFVQRDTSSLLSLGQERGEDGHLWNRYLAIDGITAAIIGGPCETCEFYFRLVRGDIESSVLELARVSTESGLSDMSTDVVDEFGSLVPEGEYVAALFETWPRKPTDDDVDDYFETEQREAWGVDHERYEISGYYRDGTSRMINETDRLFEFLVPLQPIDRIDQTRLAHYQTLVRNEGRPTAVGLGILDIHGHYDSPQSHWIFTNYLIDGHHKVEAAAMEHGAVTLLSFISIDHSWRSVPHLIASYEDQTGHP